MLGGEHEAWFDELDGEMTRLLCGECRARLENKECVSLWTVNGFLPFDGVSHLFDFFFGIDI